MPITKSIDQSKQLSVFVITGKITFDEFMEAFELFWREESTLDVLWDFRDVIGEFKNEQMKEFVSIAKEYEGCREGGKMAIVVSKDLHFGLARMFELACGDVAFEIKVFRDMGEASRWIEEEKGLSFAPISDPGSGIAGIEGQANSMGPAPHKEEEKREMIDSGIRERFGQIATRKDFITKNMLLDAMTFQVENEGKGGGAKLIGSLLQDMGYMTDGQLDEVLEEMDESDVPTCPNCGIEIIKCPNCGAYLR